jgi:hypothetical protein
MTRNVSFLLHGSAVLFLFLACAKSEQGIAPGDSGTGGTGGTAGAQAGAAGQSGSAGSASGGAAGTAGAAGGSTDSSLDQSSDADPDASDVFIPDGPDGTVSVPGLVAFYEFEEAIGPVFDLSGNSNHGTVDGSGVTRGFTGISGNAISFSGGDGRVKAPTSPTLDFTSAATIEFWIKLSSVTAGTIVGRGTGQGDNHVRIRTAQGNVNVSFGRVGTGSVSVISDAGVLQTGVWTHVAVVNSASEIRIYVNGDLNKSGSGGQMGAITADLHIGRGVSTTDTAMNGTLDQLRWFNVVRTEQEICTDSGGTVGTGADGGVVCN